MKVCIDDVIASIGYPILEIMPHMIDLIQYFSDMCIFGNPMLFDAIPYNIMEILCHREKGIIMFYLISFSIYREHTTFWELIRGYSELMKRERSTSDMYCIGRMRFCCHDIHIFFKSIPETICFGSNFLIFHGIEKESRYFSIDDFIIK